MKKMELTMEKEKIWYELPRLSKQCQCCNFYYFVTGNFKYCKYFCDGCFFCRMYEKDSKGVLTLWIIKTTKGNFRTVSSYFYKEVEESLKKTDLNEKYSWIYWNLVRFLKNLSLKNAEKRTNSGISMWNRTTISHKWESYH